jgi:hypothetical protein
VECALLGFHSLVSGIQIGSSLRRSSCTLIATSIDSGIFGASQSLNQALAALVIALGRLQD